ncbi:MAG: SUMF1/EgtB/PvdO family nonheme iron enzyme, partial [Magnetococcales bacterium]|nr:SUMF1/EgtB/PvdO family nonheme iron enzyme [Magnetococcales bacterium]
GKFYANSPGNNPGGPSSGSDRVFRGGGWIFAPAYVRSAHRNKIDPGDRYSSLGFRLARTCP